ncbi:BLUF domain-containing protein [Bdellovibrio sp. SKB1291214]|uniref:BLUF domain-containing protein n=1 Tax=Bdellovibrio sp. SKB1291214 TaxID=1732569 RepID=UPI000B51DEB8|nr:BLUF domain-containing protein [Bdellovibrio sp. SKB1291214]UYL09029.1 BLUF domain-containing protein [Bdellovibrio sp. SKB1291214]
MDKVFHLVYFSYASDSLSYSDIRDILNSSRKNNARDNITGVLIFREGFFIQVLEGNEEKVRDLVNVIRRDNRNHTLKVLIEDNSEARQFAEWSMAFLDGDISSNATKDLLEFFEACIDSSTDHKSLIMPLVRQLRASDPQFQQ